MFPASLTRSFAGHHIGEKGEVGNAEIAAGGLAKNQWIAFVQSIVVSDHESSDAETTKCFPRPGRIRGVSLPRVTLSKICTTTFVLQPVACRKKSPTLHVYDMILVQFFFNPMLPSDL